MWKVLSRQPKVDAFVCLLFNSRNLQADSKRRLVWRWMDRWMDGHMDGWMWMLPSGAVVAQCYVNLHDYATPLVCDISKNFFI